MDSAGNISVYGEVLAISGNYTVQTADSNKTIVVNSTAPCTITLPSLVPIGFQLLVVSKNIGVVTIAPPNGETLREPSDKFTINSAWRGVTIQKLDAADWWVQGMTG